MQITRTSVISGITRTREIDVTHEQLRNWWASGTYIQDALPHLSSDDREFLLSGIVSNEWEEVFGEEE